MKLKKILALALSGVMALSMLAGCGGLGDFGGSDTVKRDGGRVRTSVNESVKQLEVNFKADRDFAADLATVANNATPADVNLDQQDSAMLSGNAKSVLVYTTKIDWMDDTPTKAGTYVTGYWLDGDKTAYEVGTMLATALDGVAQSGFDMDVTDATLEAFKVTVGTGDDAKEVWLVGVVMTVADKAK